MRYRYKQYETVEAEFNAETLRWKVKAPNGFFYYTDDEFQALFELDEVKGSLNSTTTRAS